MKRIYVLLVMLAAFITTGTAYAGQGNPFNTPGKSEGVFPGDVTVGKTLKTHQGSDVASANDITLGDGNFFDITGTTTINTIATKGIGTMVVLQFDGILQLTHSADLFLPTAANITTAAGDLGAFYEYATGDWRCLDYTRASGEPLVGGTITGTDTHVMFFDGANTPAGDAGMTYDKTIDALSVGSVTTTATTAPGWTFEDLDAAVSRIHGKIYGTLTDVGDGTEDMDMYFQAMLAGVLSTFMWWDSSAEGLTVYGSLTATGTLHGKIETIEDDNSLSAAQCYGSSNWLTGAETTTLPAAVEGMSVLIYSTDATVKTIDPNGTDHVWLNGVDNGAGNSINSPGAVGDYIVLVARSDNNWYSVGRSGTWIDTP